MYSRRFLTPPMDGVVLPSGYSLMESISCSQGSCKVSLPLTNIYTLYADLRLRAIVNRAYLLYGGGAFDVFTASGDNYYKNGWNVKTYADRTNDYSGNTSYLSATTTRTELVVAPLILRAHNDFGTYYSTSSFTLFGSHGSSTIGYSNVTLYRLSFFDFFGDIVYDFLPCMRDDGAQGLFELSSSTFFPVIDINYLTLTYHEYNLITGTRAHFSYSLTYPAGSDLTIQMQSGTIYKDIIIPKGSRTTSTMLYAMPDGISPVAGLSPTQDDFYVYEITYA